MIIIPCKKTLTKLHKKYTFKSSASELHIITKKIFYADLKKNAQEYRSHAINAIVNPY